MQKHINYLVLLAAGLLLTLTGCEEVIDLKLKNTAPRIMIEGNVINQKGFSSVKLTYTGDFFDNKKADPISNATVSISDNSGKVEMLREGTEKGIYKPSADFAGEVGKTYTMSVLINGKEYKASSTLLPLTDIDSLTYKYQPKRPNKEEGFYLYLYAREPQDEKNFYRWKIYKNDSLYNGWSDLLIAEDKAIGENINGVEFPYSFKKENTRVRVEAFSLTQETYQYYTELLNVVNNDGGLFSPPPVNPKGNISNGALGFFSASAMRYREVVLKR